MSADWHEHQVRAFLDWWRRKGGPWEPAFWTWSATKAFCDLDRHVIYDRTRAELFARGILTATTLDDVA